MLPVNERVIIDVTHGLRHHQVFMASTLGFVNKLFINSKRELKLIYGALEQGKEKTTPILDLSLIVRMHQWSEALDSMLSHGNAEFLADLTRQLGMGSAIKLADCIEQLSMEIGSNYVFTDNNANTGGLPKTINKCLNRIKIFSKDIGQKGEEGEFHAASHVMAELKEWITGLSKHSEVI